MSKNKPASAFFTYRMALFVFAMISFVAAYGSLVLSINAQDSRVIRATFVSVPAGVQSQVRTTILLASQGNESSTSFSLNFNPLIFTNPVVALGSGAPENSNVEISTVNRAQGQLGILVSSTNTYSLGTREIVNVTFTIPANAFVGTHVLTFGSVPTPQRVSSSDGASLSTTYQQGGVVIGAAAASVEVSGRVLTPDGRGIRNALLVITDANGNRHFATTSSFGYYRLADITSGQTYTLSVQSKRYGFASRVVQIADTLTDLDFVGLP